MDHGINLKYNDKLFDIVSAFLFKAICKTCFDEKIPELYLTPESVTSKDLEVM